MVEGGVWLKDVGKSRSKALYSFFSSFKVIYLTQGGEECTSFTIQKDNFNERSFQL